MRLSHRREKRVFGLKSLTLDQTLCKQRKLKKALTFNIGRAIIPASYAVLLLLEIFFPVVLDEALYSIEFGIAETGEAVQNAAICDDFERIYVSHTNPEDFVHLAHVERKNFSGHLILIFDVFGCESNRSILEHAVIFALNIAKLEYARHFYIPS